LFMKKLVFLLIGTMVLLAACSSAGSDESTESFDSASESKATESSESEEADASFSEANQVKEGEKSVQPSNRMVIYNAHLGLEVKDFQSSMEAMERKTEEYGGYVVESNTYRDGEESYSGTLTVRIPQNNFQAFLNDAEGMALNVYDRAVNGEDVTEEYVDLESRLKSKRVVEARLLAFMENAEKTEDLLKISNDLANVQEEIEQLLGRMKYLENQSSLSTVTISMNEDKLVSAKLDNQDLNTWERTKNQFVSSLNFLLSLASGLIVFVVGNLPILVILLLVFIISFLIVKRARRQRNGRSSQNE
jgi:hypothetical protein